MSNKALALVARGPISQGQWYLESVVPRQIRHDEALVRMVATGICRAEVHIGDATPDIGEDPHIYYPRVLGHEGAGYVEEVGNSVKNVKVGDPVILSFSSCGHCYNCKDDHPAYCVHGFAQNFKGERGMYALAGCEKFDIAGSFFGQSSFTNRAIVKECTLVNIAGLGITLDELKVLAPLGCGVQTGVGAMTNIADVQSNEDVAILGVGGVGQSAIMASAMIGCRTIIAIDHTASRLELAKALGATHTIDTSNSTIDLVAEVLKITEGRGVHVSLDTTGIQKLAETSWEFVRYRGKVLQVGLAKPQDKWNVSMADHMNFGKQIIGCVQGDAVPQVFIRRMLGWYKAGKLPLDRIVRLYPVEQYRQAFEDMQSGETIKPVLVWTDSTSSRI